MGLLVALAFIALYSALVFLALRWSKNLMGQHAQAAADALAAAGARIVAVRPAPGVWQPAIAELTIDGRPRTFQVRRWSRYYVLFSIAVPSSPLPHVLIRPERGSDRLGKRMGYNREVQIGDAAFDDAAFIDTAEREDVVRRLLDRPDVRAAVLAVLATGYRVAMSPEGLCATRVQARLVPVDPAAVRAAALALEALVPLLPAFEPTQLARPHWFRSPRTIFIASGVAVGGFVVALVGGAAIHPLAVRGDIAQGFAMGFAVWLAAVLALYFLLRGGTRALGQFVLAAFLLLLGVPLAGTMLAFAANSALDGSPAVTHRTRVLALPANPRKGNQVTVESWRPDHDQLVIGVPRPQLKKLSVGDPMEVVTHAGALGWEWIEEFR